jgi:CMP-N-acetylneuraminate monooxygenase
MVDALLGSVDQFGNTPTPRTIEGHDVIVLRDPEGTFRVLSAICPHRGSIVEVGPQCLTCPEHGWRFDFTGNGINPKNARLHSFPVRVVGADVFVELPNVREAPDPASRPASGRAQAHLAHDLAIDVHSHACLEIHYKGESILFDPWIDGPAFLGSWVPYPPPVVASRDLRPTCIVITHEHSDHCHIPTLERLPHDVPVYLPDFPNRRLPKILSKVGFREVRPVKFGETAQLADGMSLTAFEPASVWNDAIFLLEIDGFKLLNINDAGINHRIAARVRPVDLLAVQYSIGASGYPWTWENVAPERRAAMMQRNRLGRIKMLSDAATEYAAARLLPFASDFALWHPQHRHVMRELPRVRHEDIAAAIGTGAEVLDVMPGSKWHAKTGAVSHSYVRAQVSDRAALLDHLERSFDEDTFRRHSGADNIVTRQEVVDHLLRLNSSPDMALCEDLSVSLTALDDSGRCRFEVAFEVRDSFLRILDQAPPAPNLCMKLPVWALAAIVRNDASWDEAHIGYWGSFTRDPDVYTPRFWRLLQAPYFQRSMNIPSAGDLPKIATMTVAQIIDHYGEAAELSMRRYGLYCGLCHRAAADTLSDAAAQHGLEKRQVDDLIRELARIEPTSGHARSSSPASGGVS